MADIALALEVGARGRAEEDLRRVRVSTDVKHDTGPVIAQWLVNFAPNTTATFVGLRGTQAQIDAAQTAAHMTVAEDSGQTHSAVVLLYGRRRLRPGGVRAEHHRAAADRARRAAGGGLIDRVPGCTGS